MIAEAISSSCVRKQMSRIISVVLFLGISVGVIAQAQQDPPRVVKINDSIFMAPLGPNVYLVTTTAGNVVIDTGSAGVAPDARKLLAAESHGPVKYIILTHGHADHIAGIS